MDAQIKKIVIVPAKINDDGEIKNTRRYSGRTTRIPIIRTRYAQERICECRDNPQSTENTHHGH